MTNVHLNINIKCFSSTLNPFTQSIILLRFITAESNNIQYCILYDKVEWSSGREV